MIRFLICILHWFRPLLTRTGVNFDQLVSIVSVKLTVDNRIDKSGRERKNQNNALVRQGIILGFVGLMFFVMFMYRGFSMALLLFHGMLSIMLIMNFLLEYSQLLFNSNDNHIILRTPVNGRTLLASRLISMLYYMMFLFACLSIGPVIVTCLWHGPLPGFALLVAGLLNSFFSLLVANAVYLILMKFMSGEKLQKVISYVQIAFTIIIIIGYQALAHLDDSMIIDLATVQGVWIYFTPPAYYAAFTVLVNGGGMHLLFPALLGMILPIVLFIITLRYLSNGFTTQMSTTDVNASSSGRVKRSEKTVNRIAGLVAHKGLQKAGFMLMWRMTQGNMKFKQAIIPGFIYCLIMIAILCYRQFQGEETNSFITTASLYFTAMLIPMLTLGSCYSNGESLLPLFRSRPLDRPGEILLGAGKALIVKYLIPFFLLTAIPILFLTKGEGIKDILFILSVMIILMLLGILILSPLFPFSKEKGSVNTAGSIGTTMLFMLFCGILGGIHYGLSQIPYSITIGFIVLWGIIWLLARKIRHISWKKIEKEYR